MRAGTHADRILALLAQSPDLDDDEIARALEIEPRQTVNQTCRMLAGRGLLIRKRGVRGKIVNRLATESPFARSRPQSCVRTASVKPVLETHGGESLVPRDLRKTLIILPCSDAKKADAPAGGGGERVERYLPEALARELRAAQAGAKARVEFDESTLVPAWRRYDGKLYRTGRDAISGLMKAGAHVLILSGGYGLLSAREPIGLYNTVLKPGWWPDQVLERALVAYAKQARVVSVRGFASASSAYRQVLQRVPWRVEGIEDALLILPEPQRGGLVKSPATLGEALVALNAGTLTTGWRSSYGLSLTVLRC